MLIGTGVSPTSAFMEFGSTYNLCPGMIKAQYDNDIGTISGDNVASGGSTPVHFVPIVVPGPCFLKGIGVEQRGNAWTFTGGKGKVRFTVYKPQENSALHLPGVPLDSQTLEVQMIAGTWVQPRAEFTGAGIFIPAAGLYWIAYQFQDGFSAGNYWGQEHGWSFGATSPNGFSHWVTAAQTYAAAWPTFASAVGLTNAGMNLAMMFRFTAGPTLSLGGDEGEGA